MYNVIETKGEQVSSFIYWDEKEASKELLSKAESHLYWNEISEEVAGFDKKEILKEKKFSFEDYTIQLVEPESDYNLIEGMDTEDIFWHIRQTEETLQYLHLLTEAEIDEVIENQTGNGIYVLRSNNIIEELKAQELVEKFPNV